MEIDESKVIAVGSLAWAIAFVVLLVTYPQLADNGNEWWIWTALAGLGLGFWGWLLVHRRVRARRGHDGGAGRDP